MLNQEAAKHYRELFDLLERTLLERASTKSNDEFQIDPDKVEYRREKIVKDHIAARQTTFNRDISNIDLWHLIASRPFYANRRSLHVNKKIDHMLTYLEQPEALCEPEWNPPTNTSPAGARFQEFLDDPGCRGERVRLEIVVNAARTIMKRFDVKNGKPWIKVIIPNDCDANNPKDISRIIERMSFLFRKGWGSVTSLHLMTDLGLPVVKPDVVLTQISARLGIMEEYKNKPGSDDETTISVSHEINRSKARSLGQDEYFQNDLQKKYQSIANHTGRTMRELDFIVVKLGQEVDDNAPYVRQICGQTPECSICYAATHCLYAQRSRTRR